MLRVVGCRRVVLSLRGVFSRPFSTSTQSSEDRDLHNPLVKDIPIYDGEVVGKGDLTETYVRPFAWSFKTMMNFTQMVKVLARAYRWVGPGGNVNYLEDMSTLPKADTPFAGRRFLNKEQDLTSNSRNPSQRESAADLFRLRKVKEDLSNYNIPPKQKLRDINRPTALDGYGGLVEARIIEAMEEYNPPGTKAQLSFLEETNPFLDETTSRTHRMMKESGCLPEWIELRKEIKQDTKYFQDSLGDTIDVWLRETKEGAIFQESRRWPEVKEFMDGKLKEINKKILHYNLIVPSINLQQSSLRMKVEIEYLLAEKQK